MTAAPPALAAVWLDLVNGDAHPMQALDEAMARLGTTDRAAAMAALHDAAAEWLDPQRPDGTDGNSLLDRLRDCDLDFALQAGRLFRCYRKGGSLDFLPAAPRWLAWCDRAESAIALLRALAAVP